jgi:triacylglycerol lipase
VTAGERRHRPALLAQVVALVLVAGICGGFAFALAGPARHVAHQGQAATPPRPPRPPRPAPPTVLNSAHCKPPPQHPDPVVLVPGTFDATSWALIGPALARRGYCVSMIDYGNGGTVDIRRSAHQLATDVRRILARTGAHQVAIVGHSEGGMMPRYYIKQLAGAGKVSDLVALSPSNHGTTNPLALMGALSGCTACGQQLTYGSTFLQRLNAGSETPPPVDYTVVQTRYDLVITPYQSAFLNGPGARVTNVTLQDRCPGDQVDHLNVPTDPVALQWVEDALAVDGPASPSFRPTC